MALEPRASNLRVAQEAALSARARVEAVSDAIENALQALPAEAALPQTDEALEQVSREIDALDRARPAAVQELKAAERGGERELQAAAQDRLALLDATLAELTQLRAGIFRSKPGRAADM